MVSRQNCGFFCVSNSPGITKKMTPMNTYFCRADVAARKMPSAVNNILQDWAVPKDAPCFCWGIANRRVCGKEGAKMQTPERQSAYHHHTAMCVPNRCRQFIFSVQLVVLSISCFFVWIPNSITKPFGEQEHFPDSFLFPL